MMEEDLNHQNSQSPNNEEVFNEISEELICTICRDLLIQPFYLHIDSCEYILCETCLQRMNDVMNIVFLFIRIANQIHGYFYQENSRINSLNIQHYMVNTILFIVFAFFLYIGFYTALVSSW